MAMVATVLAKLKYLNGHDLIVKLVFSGSYVTTVGEVLDFDLLDPITSRQPVHVNITNKNSQVIYTYDKIQKTIRIWTNSAGGADGIFAEMSSAAYLASITADPQIEARVTFA